MHKHRSTFNALSFASLKFSGIIYVNINHCQYISMINCILVIFNIIIDDNLRMSFMSMDSATSLSLFTFMHGRRKWHPTPVFLPGES